MNLFIFRSVRLLFPVRFAHRSRGFAAPPGSGSLRSNCLVGAIV